MEKLGFMSYVTGGLVALALGICVAALVFFTKYLCRPAIPPPGLPRQRAGWIQYSDHLLIVGKIEEENARLRKLVDVEEQLAAIREAKRSVYENCADLIRNYSPDLNSSGTGGSVEELARAIEALERKENGK